jgi:20S proteasome subunit beta 2
MTSVTNMQQPLVVESDEGGFNFDHFHRNQMILPDEKLTHTAGSTPTTPSIVKMARKTGTTIVGMTFANGVVLGADTRATGGSEVAEKNCEKIHYMAPNIYCCGAGTAADTENVTCLMASQLALLRMQQHGKASRVVTACTLLKRMLFRYQGRVSAALVLGGVDAAGPHIYQIYPHGSTGKLPYTTMGSGSLAAMAIFESDWQQDMNEEDAVKLVQRATLAGIMNDLGSGSNVDVCVIRLDGTVDMRRNCIKPNEIAPYKSAIQHSARFQLAPGTTPIVSSTINVPHKKPLSLAQHVVTTASADDTMEEG